MPEQTPPKSPLSQMVPTTLTVNTPAKPATKPVAPASKQARSGSAPRPVLASKKFWAFLLTVLSLDVLLGVGMFLWLPLDQWSTTVLLGLVVVLGVVAVGYIIGQAGLDALTHLFDIITPDRLFGSQKDKDPPA